MAQKNQLRDRAHTTSLAEELSIIGGKFAAQSQRRRTIVRGHIGNNTRVVVRFDDDRDRLVVLGGTADHGRSANVDVFDAIVARRAVSDRRHKRIEIDDEEIDRRDAVCAGGLVVLGVAANGEQPAVNARMQGLDAPVHHFRKARQLGDVGDGETGSFQCGRGAARRDQCHAMTGECAGEVDETRFVGNRQQRAADFLLAHVRPSVTGAG